MTGKHLRIKRMGDNVLGVELEGNPKKPEPIHFRVEFPFGDVDIVRTTDDDYWVHVRVNHPDDGDEPYRTMGRVTDARLDIKGKHASECDAGDFADENLYHLAVRVAPRQPSGD